MEIFTMILKMTAVTLLYVIVSFFVWKRTKDNKLTSAQKVVIGILYGILSIFSTHFAIDFETMLLNVRDLGPMIAGMFFDPVSGIIAGLIGSIERYIVGTYFGIGEYTRVACSISTCLAGFLAAFMRVFIFKGKKPSIMYAFFIGAFIEVFHMYVVFITHRSDMLMAFYVVRTCSAPMIIFSGLGLALTAAVIKKSLGEMRNPLVAVPKEKVPVSQKFQTWLFGVTVAVLLLNFGFNYSVQSEAAVQEAKLDLVSAARDISNSVTWLRERGGNIKNYTHYVGMTGSFAVIDAEGNHVAGTYPRAFNESLRAIITEPEDREFFNAEVYGEESLCYVRDIAGNLRLFVRIPMKEVYEARDIQAYETMLADILLFTVIYMLISQLVQQIVVQNLDLVNDSLAKITDGDLDEVVAVRSTSEFASLSDDINQTVDVLKGYIDAAEKRIEQELELARTIQDSALPRNFHFPRENFELYATMDPAKEVGGDFYDFFFVGPYRLALVIADVSGKGIPASLFMMRSKTAIRSTAESGSSPAEILYKANNALCEGNDAEMFVTAWLGIVDLRTGLMTCASAGHEYPMLMRAGQDFALFKDKHGLALAAMEGVRFKEYEVQLNPGDRLFVYTDGVPEAIDENVVQYGTDRLERILNVEKDRPMEEILPGVRRDISEFVGKADQFDDITMLGFTWFGTGKEGEREGADA